MGRRGSRIGDTGCAVQLGIFAVLLIGGLLLLQSITGLPTSFIGSIQTAAPPATPTVIVLPPVIDVISQNPRLETASYFLSTVAEAKQQVGLLQQEQSVLLVACGKVTAGIDISKLNEENVLVTGTTVVMQLPEAEIFEAFLIEDDEPECTYVAHRSDGILLAASETLETEARRQAIASFRQSALENGILETAAENAQTELQRLLFLVGYRDIQFAVEFVP